MEVVVVVLVVVVIVIKILVAAVVMVLAVVLNLASVFLEAGIDAKTMTISRLNDTCALVSFRNFHGIDIGMSIFH